MRDGEGGHDEQDDCKIGNDNHDGRHDMEKVIVMNGEVNHDGENSESCNSQVTYVHNTYEYFT